MNRKDFIQSVVSRLENEQIKKLIVYPKQFFRISDSSGNKKDFKVKPGDRYVAYTKKDISVILDAFISTVKETLVHGESIGISGFGTICLRQRGTRSNADAYKKANPGSSAPRFFPKIIFGRDIKMCAKIFELSLNDNAVLDDTDADEEVVSVDVT